MVRKNYFEILDNMHMQFDPSIEFDNLHILLSNGLLLEELKDKFLNYGNRGTFITFDEFLDCLLLQAENEQERLFIFTEFLIDILPIVNPISRYFRNDILTIKKIFNDF